MCLVVLCLGYCAVCDVTFIALEQYHKHVDEQQKQAVPVLIKVPKISKDQKEQHKAEAQAQFSKTKHEWQSKEPRVVIQEPEMSEIFEKDQLYSDSMPTIKTPSTCDIKTDTLEHKTDETKHQEKKPEEYKKTKEQRHAEPDPDVPLTDSNSDFKDKIAKAKSPKAPSKTIKKIPTIPSAKLEHEKVMLKPFERPDKSKEAPMKKKETKTTAKNIEEMVATKPVVLASKVEHREPEVLTKTKIVPTEDDEVGKSSLKDPERSEIDEKSDKEDKVKIQTKKTETSPKEEAKPLIIKKGRHILKECEDKENISLKPVEHLKKDAELDKILPKFEKPKEENSALTTVIKTKESPKEAGETTVFKKSVSLPEKIMEEEKISLKPVELVKKGEAVKRTLSPKAEPIPLQRKSSAIVPKKVSPKDSIETVTLKKVPIASDHEKASQEHPKKEKQPLMKELSPGAVQLQKIPTQQEEEVLEEEFKDEEQDEEEETWGWELLPSDGYEEFDTTLEDGAIETPGGTGDKIGEREYETSPLVFHACPGPKK